MIEAESVSLRYNDGAVALRDIDLSLDRGSLHFLTGPSGAGKSSLMRLLYLARPPSSGRLRIDGRDAARFSRREIARQRRAMGVVFQEFRLLDHLTVYENVALPLVVAGEREAQFRADVLEMLEWVMLQDKIALRPNSLSGGEKQRVAIARAMVTAPDLILADEPTGSVDPEMGERIMSLFLEMQSLDRTVLIATHDMALVRRIGAPVLRLEAGRLARDAADPASAAGTAAEPQTFAQSQAFGETPERFETLRPAAPATLGQNASGPAASEGGDARTEPGFSEPGFSEPGFSVPAASAPSVPEEKSVSDPAIAAQGAGELEPERSAAEAPGAPPDEAAPAAAASPPPETPPPSASEPQIETPR